MKKTLLKLGLVAMRGTFIINVISCGDNIDEHNRRVVKNFVQSLNGTNSTLKKLISKDWVIGSDISKKAVLTAIRNATVNGGDLSARQQSLLVTTDISLKADDVIGNLTITITNHGPSKKITLSGFSTTDQVAINKFVKNFHLQP